MHAAAASTALVEDSYSELCRHCALTSGMTEGLRSELFEVSEGGESRVTLSGSVTGGPTSEAMQRTTLLTVKSFRPSLVEDGSGYCVDPPGLKLGAGSAKTPIGKTLVDARDRDTE